MKVLSISINGKTYMTGKITAFLSKEALKIQRDALKLAKTAKEIMQHPENMENELDRLESVYDEMEELNQRRVWLICEAYQNQFTADEIEKQYTNEEIGNEVNKIISGVTGIISKN